MADTNSAGQVVLVCGASSGIGEATARRLASAGARVARVGRRRAAGEALADDLRAGSGEAYFCAADMTRETDAATAVEQAVSRYGRLDGAFNNVGDVVAGGSVTALNLAAWNAELNINLTSVFLGLKHQIPAICDTAGCGSIVNSAAVADAAGVAGMAAYSAAKHGVVGLTRAAALEVAEHNLRINALITGTVDTPLLRRLLGAEPEDSLALDGLNPAGRLAAADEIAAFVQFLLSDDARFITGAALPIDGGLLPSEPRASELPGPGGSRRAGQPAGSCASRPVSGRAGEKTQSTWARPAVGSTRKVCWVLAGNVKASPCSRVVCSPATVMCSWPARTKMNSTSAGSE